MGEDSAHFHCVQVLFCPQVFEVNSVVTGGGCLLVFVFWEEFEEEDIEAEETEDCCCF